MLTLKVITTDLNGQPQTHIFNGDSISHKEYFSDDHCIVSKICKENSTTWIIGSISETSSTQKFTVSEVDIYDDDRYIKNKLFNEKEYEWVLKKDPCTICLSVYQSLLEKLDDHKKVFDKTF